MTPADRIQSAADRAASTVDELRHVARDPLVEAMRSGEPCDRYPRMVGQFIAAASREVASPDAASRESLYDALRRAVLIDMSDGDFAILMADGLVDALAWESPTAGCVDRPMGCDR